MTEKNGQQSREVAGGRWEVGDLSPECRGSTAGSLLGHLGNLQYNVFTSDRELLFNITRGAGASFVQSMSPENTIQHTRYKSLQSILISFNNQELWKICHYKHIRTLMSMGCLGYVWL